MATDKIQVGLLLAGNISCSDKRLAQGHRLKEHIWSGLTHNNVSGGHEGRNLFCKWKRIEITHRFKTRKKRMVCSSCQNDLQPLTNCLHAFDSASKLCCAFTSALQEDGEASRIQTQFRQ